jgi:hypothetical protein
VPLAAPESDRLIPDALPILGVLKLGEIRSALVPMAVEMALNSLLSSVPFMTLDGLPEASVSLTE